jgi:hydroxypyruvate isomerase
MSGRLRFDANLKWLFTEVPFLERFDEAAKAGFTAVEYAAPYDYSAGELRRRLDDAGLHQILINTPSGPDGSPTRNGAACVPGAEREFREGVVKALDYATELGAPLVHLMAGVRPAEVDEDRSFATLVLNVGWAAEQARTCGVRLVLEAINKRDVPGFGLASMEAAATVAEVVGNDAVSVLFDIYHAQVDRGDLALRLDALLPCVGHIQVADNPGRHEPGTGEIAYPFIFEKIADSGYPGWIGCEYAPLGDTLQGLGWLTQIRAC